jgi:hypothetical protein
LKPIATGRVAMKIPGKPILRPEDRATFAHHKMEIIPKVIPVPPWRWARFSAAPRIVTEGIAGAAVAAARVSERDQSPISFPTSQKKLLPCKISETIS